MINPNRLRYVQIHPYRIKRTEILLDLELAIDKYLLKHRGSEIKIPLSAKDGRRVTPILKKYTDNGWSVKMQKNKETKKVMLLFTVAK